MEKSMKKEENFQEKLKLRKRAEEALQGEPADISDLSEDEMRHHIHELRVHQIELEMQNEELRRTQLELEAARDKYSDLYDFAPVGYFTISAEGMILEANLTGAGMLGVERALLTGSPFSEFINRDDQDIYYHHRRQLSETKNKQTCELRLVEKDRAQFYAQVVCIPVFNENGNLDRVRAAATDITALKRAKDAAEDANRAKSEFLANMSHEIRTPMNSILGFAEILKGKIKDKQQKRYLSIILSSGNSLLTLINDILDLSKIEAGKIEIKYKAVNPISVFNEITRVFSQKISTKGLNYSLASGNSMPEYLLLDEARLRQILLNLVGNAVKFTESGSVNIEVKTLAYKETPGLVDFTFTVEDTGIGIPADQQEIIFEAFEQQKGIDHTGYSGTGLGLAISKRLAEMMEGTISVASEKDQGSIFTVTLKNVRKAVTGDAPGRENDISVDSVIFDKAVILLADDITSNLMLLLNYLKNYNFEFIRAKNGLEACNLTKRHCPDLILMDMKMPVMDGCEATQIIKTCDATKNIPIIAVTADIMNTSKKKFKTLGDGYLKKPVTKTALIAEMRRFLKHSVKAPVQ